MNMSSDQVRDRDVFADELMQLRNTDSVRNLMEDAVVSQKPRKL